jgi:hypothetical protein
VSHQRHRTKVNSPGCQNNEAVRKQSAAFGTTPIVAASLASNAERKDVVPKQESARWPRQEQPKFARKCERQRARLADVSSVGDSELEKKGNICHQNAHGPSRTDGQQVMHHLKKIGTDSKELNADRSFE